MRGLVPQHRLEHNVAPWCKRANASRRRGPSADRLASEVRWSGQVGRAPANVVAFVQMHRFHVMKSSLLLAIWCALVAVGSGGCAGIPVCQLNSECQHGFYCLGGKCLRDCAEAEFDCLDGYVCNANGQCEGTGTSGMGGAGGTTKSVTSATTGGAGAGGATVSSSVAAGGATASSTTGTGGAPTKGLLDVCTTAAQCTLGHCEPMTVGGKSRCTTACTASAQCPRGTRCLNYGNGKYCLGDDVGRSCSGPSSCNASCLSVQGGPSYCTAPCASGADCPNGYGCNNDPGQSVCIRAEGYCTSASECTQACDPNPPLLIGGCTALCATAADCPQRAVPLTPWTCFGGYCLRPTDVIGTLEGGYSPTEYHCNGGQVANLCNDGLNTSFTSSTPPTPPAINCQSPPEQSVAGAADDSCVNSCRYGGGCAYGFNCVALGDLVTERIGVCMPSGAGEPGSACANNTQCVFGYCANNKCSRDCTVDGICPGGLQCKNGGAPAVEGQVFKRCE